MAAAVTETKYWTQACPSKAGQTTIHCSKTLSDGPQTALRINYSTPS